MTNLDLLNRIHKLETAREVSQAIIKETIERHQREILKLMETIEKQQKAIQVLQEAYTTRKNLSKGIREWWKIGVAIGGTLLIIVAKQSDPIKIPMPSKQIIKLLSRQDVAHELSKKIKNKMEESKGKVI